MSLRNCLKCIIYPVTVPCTAFGAALAVLGYINLISHKNHVKVTHFFHNFGTILIVIGALIAIVSLAGLLGVLCENRCLLLTFSAMMIFLVIVELVVLIALFAFYNEETLREELKSSLQYYDEEKDIKKLWDLINNKLECCGVDSVEDWRNNIPNSCCKDLDINDVCHKEQAYETPCLPEIVTILKKKLPVSFSVLCGVQIIYISVGICLSRL